MSKAPAILAELYPDALLFGCSTAAGILGNEMEEGGVVAVACHFRAATLRLVEAPVAAAAGSEAAGRQLGEALRDDLDGQRLAGVILLSDGVRVEGGALTAGLQRAVGGHVPVSGGMASDGARFVHTVVGVGAVVRSGYAAALGLYGGSVRLAFGSAGGWDPFGPRRRITRSSGCLLEELDGKPALELYERYLGEESAGLPATAMLFPLLVWDPDAPARTVVRAVLGIDRAHGTMTFSGCVPEGWGAQLMRGNLDHLVDGAARAAELARDSLDPQVRDAGQNALALVISCVGRQMAFGQRVGDELHAVGKALGTGLTRIGFYSHGEIAPDRLSGLSMLQNQTMVVTLLAEAP